MELKALGMAQHYRPIFWSSESTSLLCKRKGHYFSTPSEIISKLKSVSQLDVPYPMSWVDEERDTSSWLGNVLQA